MILQDHLLRAPEALFALSELKAITKHNVVWSGRISLCKQITISTVQQLFYSTTSQHADKVETTMVNVTLMVILKSEGQWSFIWK